MKKRYYVPILILVLIILLITYSIAHIILSAKYGKGVIGSVTNMSDVPYMCGDLKGLKVSGEIYYVYKRSYRNLHYMITGKTTEKDLREFCKLEDGWEISYVSEWSGLSWEYEFFKVNSKKIPINKSEGEYIIASKISENCITNGVWEMDVHYRIKDQRFTAYVLVNGYRL